MGRRLRLQGWAQTGLACLLLLGGGCSKLGVPVLTSAEAKEKTVTPSTLAPRMTEAGIITALNGLWRSVNGLPAHLTIHAAAFEFVGQGPAGAKLRISVWLCCTQDSFEPVRQLFSSTGKVTTIVRQVYARGQLIEIPLQVDDATMDRAGGVSLGASLKCSPKAWGQPWNSFANAVDLATDKGARLATAPKEVADGERWLDEQQGRKADLDRLMQALETHGRNKVWGKTESASVIKRYPEASLKVLAMSAPVDEAQALQKLLQWQEEMEPIIRADFAKFDAEYLEVLHKVSAAKKLLDDD